MPPASRRLRSAARRGLAAGWLLIFSPVFLLVLLLAVEVGNVMLAKVQLVNALEAASLAAVKQWKLSGSTSQARTYAQAYAAANTVSGEQVILDRNDTPPNDPNGNASPAGEIVLGAVDPDDNDPCLYCFDPGTSPGGGGTGLFVDLDVRVVTKTGTRVDFQGCSSGSTCNDLPFRISGFQHVTMGGVPVAGSTLEIASVTFDVTDTDLNDPNNPRLQANFDLRVKSSGNSNDKDFGLVPLFNSMGSVSLASSDFVSLPTHQIVPNNSPGPLSQTFALFFDAASSNPFRSGDTLRFGVDTDGVGPDPAPNPGNNPFPADTDYADVGCDFAGTQVTVTFRFMGMDAGQITGTMVNFTDGDGKCQSRIQFDNAEIVAGSFGVLTRRTMPVEPICAKLLGALYPFTPINVCGEAVAVCERNSSPKLVRTVNCTPQ